MRSPTNLGLASQSMYGGKFGAALLIHSCKPDGSYSDRTHGRLGLTKFPKSHLGQSVPFPTQLVIPGVRVVSLIAGGW